MSSAGLQRITLVEGTMLPLAGENIDTDRIIPARFLRTVSFDGLEQHVFADDRAAAAAEGSTHPFDEPRFQRASILIVNANFGCGSSREHAPQALYRRGIRAIVGESFSEIFFGNAVMIGLPCVTASAGDVRALQAAAQAQPEVEAAIDLEALQCRVGTETRTIALPPNAREALMSGSWDATGILLADRDAIARTAGRLPYLVW